MTVHGVRFDVNEDTVRMLAEANFESLMKIREMREVMSAKSDTVTATDNTFLEENKITLKILRKEMLSPPPKEYVPDVPEYRKYPTEPVF